MAYVYRKADDESKTTGGGDAAQIGQNLVSDTDSASISGASRDAPGSASGSGWTNLQSYVAANKGESERGAQRIVGDIAEKRESTAEKVGQFGDTSVTGYDKADDTFLDDLRAGRSGPAREGQTLENLYGGGWEGPESASKVEGYDTTLGAVQDFGRSSDILSDPNKIVEEYNPGSTIGEKSLDRFFYQQKPAQEIFQREFDAGDSIDDQWSKSLAGLEDRIATNRQSYGTQQTNIEDAFKQGLSGYESQFDPNINQAYVDQQNARRQQEYQDLIGGAGRGGRVGDYLSSFGDTAGYDFGKMFGYGGDTSLGDYVGNTESVGDYRDFLDQFGGAFGAEDMFGGDALQASGNLGTNPAATADMGQKTALAELGALYGQGPDADIDRNRWNELLTTLGVQGFTDLRPKAPPPPPAPARPPPVIGSDSLSPHDDVTGRAVEHFQDFGDELQAGLENTGETLKKTVKVPENWRM